jgi:hypothetical protein
MSLLRRIECFLFSAALITFAWFNQGGGWNQNARFAEVRAIVDGGELSIDNFLCYKRHGGKTLRRYPVINGDVTIGNKTSSLCWVTDDGDLIPINGAEIPENMDGVALDDLTCSGDVSFAMGHFHPNKPPGLSFMAVPAYFVISHYERLMHRNPDTWWLLNVNAWLTSVFSVGLVSAAGVVLAFRVAFRLSGGRTWPAFWTAVTLGFGTLFFPFATLLFDHDVTAIVLLAAFYCLFQWEGARWVALAGLLAGLGAITNYVAAVPAGMLGIYLLAIRGRGAGWSAALRSMLWYGVGLAGPLVAICAYNRACYGSPFALCNAFQNPSFIGKGPVFLGMFGEPDPAVALILLISPFRGVFYGAPILAMGVYGLVRMRRAFGAEMALFIGIALTFFLVNCAFCGWHGGFACGPRYLIPATTFLALPAVYGFMGLPRISGALLAASIGINFIFAATDAESPAGVGALARTTDREMYLYSPFTEYALPLFVQGRAWPILNLLIKERLDQQSEVLTASHVTPEAQKPALKKLEADLRQSIAEGSDEQLDLGSYVGPVSVNPTGICEGGYYSLFDARTVQARWNSFNVGEFWFPESRWSLAPLLGLVGLLGAGLAWEAARAGARRRGGVPAAFGEGLAAEEIAAD